MLLQVPSSRAGGQGPEDGQARNEVLKELLTSAGNMQDRQERMDQLLADMKKENEALWREVARLRQKHMKQQQIVEKLIQFLVTMVQANRNITVKRKMPLMLHDSPSSTSKVPRLTKGALVTDYQVTSVRFVDQSLEGSKSFCQELDLKFSISLLFYFLFKGALKHFVKPKHVL